MSTSAPSNALITANTARVRPVSGSSGHLSSTPACRCPECGDVLNKIPRRGVDRALSLFASLHRYRCHNLLCQWEGNLRDGRLRIGEVLNAVGLPSASGHNRW